MPFILYSTSLISVFIKATVDVYWRHYDIIVVGSLRHDNDRVRVGCLVDLRSVRPDVSAVFRRPAGADEGGGGGVGGGRLGATVRNRRIPPVRLYVLSRRVRFQLPPSGTAVSRSERVRL